MRSNYDTYRQRRLEVLQDLQKYSRRAKGIAPVANYEDIGIIRNTIRPALELDKFAAVVEFVPDPSELTLILDLSGIDKIAGWLGDVWEGIKGGAGRLWQGVKTLGTDVLWPTLKLPYSVGKSIYEHVGDAWRPGSGILGNLGRSAVGAISGIMEPVEGIAAGAYRGLRDVGTGTLGMLPGAELGFQGLMRDPTTGKILRTADIAGESIARIAPSVATMFLPGGQGAGAAGIGANLARLGLGAAKYGPMAQGLLSQWPHTGGGIGEGLRATMMGERHEGGPAPTVAQGVPQGQIQPMDQFGQQFGSVMSQMNPTSLLGTLMPGVTPEQFQNIGGLIGQMPQGMLVPAGAMA